MSTLGDARMSTLRDKIEASAGVVDEKTVKAEGKKGRVRTKVKKLEGEKVKKITKRSKKL